MLGGPQYQQGVTSKAVPQFPQVSGYPQDEQPDSVRAVEEETKSVPATAEQATYVHISDEQATVDIAFASDKELLSALVYEQAESVLVIRLTEVVLLQISKVIS